MLKKIRNRIIKSLWELYCEQSIQISAIEAQLQMQKIAQPPLDHFALIDLPSAYTGITTMHAIFSTLGFVARGKDYLPDKQNDFLWMVESDYEKSAATQILPQIVIADFRLEAMPEDVQTIIQKYAAFAKPFNFNYFETLLSKALNADVTSEKQLIELITHYFNGRDWPLPTISEFNTVNEFNELLAWVLIYGRRPNHFTFAIHLTNHFENLNDFLLFIEKEVGLSLNHEGGVIKGNEQVGIQQASTLGCLQSVTLTDGVVYLPNSFVEFVWRYPNNHSANPFYWQDYYTDFIAQHANRVVESLFVASK